MIHNRAYPLVLDGAVGTELIARGLRVREESPESWNLTRPDDVRAIHAAYAAAGARALHLETQFHPLELRTAITGARQGAPQVFVIASMALMPGVTGLETPHGVPMAKMMRALQDVPPDAVGVNCAVEAERMLQ